MLIVKGFKQQEGIDFNEIFLFTVKHTTIRSVLNIVAAKNLHLEQLDIKTAFLQGNFGVGYLHVTATRTYHAREGTIGLQAKKSLWLEICSEAVVSEV